jgi:hypothetical protein
VLYFLSGSGLARLWLLVKYVCELCHDDKFVVYKPHIYRVVTVCIARWILLRPNWRQCKQILKCWRFCIKMCGLRCPAQTYVQPCVFVLGVFALILVYRSTHFKMFCTFWTAVRRIIWSCRNFIPHLIYFERGIYRLFWWMGYGLDVRIKGTLLLVLFRTHWETLCALSNRFQDPCSEGKGALLLLLPHTRFH